MGCKRLQCVYTKRPGTFCCYLWGFFWAEKSFEFQNSFKSQVLNVFVLQQMVVARTACAIFNMQVTKIEQVLSDGLTENYFRPVVIDKVITAMLVRS